MPRKKPSPVEPVKNEKPTPLTRQPKPVARRAASQAEIPAEVCALAVRLQINPQDLLAWKVYDAGKVVLIAPNGMKFSGKVNDEH